MTKYDQNLGGGGGGFWQKILRHFFDVWNDFWKLLICFQYVIFKNFMIKNVSFIHFLKFLTKRRAKFAIF